MSAREHGVKIGGPLVGLQLRDRQAPDEAPRVGFTVTKKVGGAVERNRMKRRLRAAAREALAPQAKAGCDYVLVARRAVLDASFDRLLRDVGEAVRRAHGRTPSLDQAKSPAQAKSFGQTQGRKGSPPRAGADDRESGR